MKPYIGTPTSRVDGRAKVTGAAIYAGEFQRPGLAYGAVLASTIAKGRIRRIDVSRAMAVEGVIEVLTHENRPKMARTDRPTRTMWRRIKARRSGRSTTTRSCSTASRWRWCSLKTGRPRDLRLPSCASNTSAQSHDTDLHARLDQAFVVEKPAKPRGDAGQSASPQPSVRHEAQYFIPTEHHNPMELFASTVVWEGDGKLTVYDKTQGVQNVQRYICSVFDLKADDVRVMSPFVGGAFGSGLRPQYEVVLAVLGALKLRRSVRLVLTREQMYGLGYRPASIQRVALGANPDGSLDVITHEAIAMTSQYEEFSRNDTGWAAQLYKSPNAKYIHKLTRLDVSTPADMRAPGATSGVYALECAMDELAIALKMDPVELRLRCYSDRDQNEDVPFTSKQLKECYRQAAEAFGWAKRNPEPRSMRDGNELVGWGMAIGSLGGAAR